MNKIKFLAFIAATAVLFACGSQDGSPPKLKNGGRIGFISPFDTLVAEFDSKIVDVDSITSSQDNIIQVHPNNPSGNKLYFIGTHDTTPGGLPHFKPEIMGGSIVFSNVKNDDDYTRKTDTLHFSTYRILDSEVNDAWRTANEIASEETTFAGVLDHKVIKETGTIYDMDDYYKIKLKAADVLTITIDNFREPLDVTIKRFNGVEDTTFAVLKKDKINTFIYRVGTDYLLDTALTRDDMVYFYIGISDLKLNAPPNPYTISVKRN